MFSLTPLSALLSLCCLPTPSHVHAFTFPYICTMLSLVAPGVTPILTTPLPTPVLGSPLHLNTLVYALPVLFLYLLTLTPLPPPIYMPYLASIPLPFGLFVTRLLVLVLLEVQLLRGLPLLMWLTLLGCLLPPSGILVHDTLPVFPVIHLIHHVVLVTCPNLFPSSRFFFNRVAFCQRNIFFMLRVFDIRPFPYLCR